MLNAECCDGYRTENENSGFLSELWRTETKVFWSQVKTVLPSDVCIYIVSYSMNRRTADGIVALTIDLHFINIQ